MPPIDDPLLYRPRPPVVSNTLLSAALGGLLSLAASCSPSGDASTPDSGTAADAGSTGDAGTPTDAGTPVDLGALVDALIPPDTGVDPDAGGDPDAGTDPDAGVDMDAGIAMDASTPTDAGPPVDMGPRDAPCDVDPLRSITATDAAPGMTLDEFTALCDGLGGFIEIHPHCGGMNTCRGISYDSGTGVLTEHTCAGLNTCTGFSCVIP